MPISFKNRLAFTFLACALLLPACSGKQAPAPVLELTEMKEFDPSGADLSHTELKALKTTGQIDKHVPEHAMNDVAAQYKYFLRKGRNTMCAFSKRSEQYLAYARKVFKSRGMPEELANLAIVESGYKPNAISHAGAAGAWQFMPETGLKYGLAQDWWQDERFDPYHATEAAADYLQKLYNDFGDWPTAIAAYNAGEGKISRAKEGTGGKDFYEVNALNHTLDEKRQLKDETRQYVPRFMAVTKIMRNLPDLGFEPIAPEASPEVMRLKARPGTDLREFSQACNLSWREFANLNQHHKRPITCTERETYVYVPLRVKQAAENYLCAPQQASYAGWRPVTVAGRNDSLENISKRANIPLARLQAANPGISRLKSGQVIIAPLAARLPSRNNATDNTKLTKAAKSSVPARSGAIHKLKANETLFSVAKKYNLKVAELKSFNGITDPSKLKPGLALNLPVASTPTKAGPSGQIGSRKSATYTVKEKDNLWSIARKHKISVGDLRRWNKISANNLKPGAKLVVAEE